MLEPYFIHVFVTFYKIQGDVFLSFGDVHCISSFVLSLSCCVMEFWFIWTSVCSINLIDCSRGWDSNGP